VTKACIYKESTLALLVSDYWGSRSPEGQGHCDNCLLWSWDNPINTDLYISIYMYK